MGLGLSGGGTGAAKFFVEEGSRVTVTDLKTEKELDKSLRELKSLKASIKFILGEHRKEDFCQADLIIRNPDVKKDSPYLKIARDYHVPVEMEESLFLKLCPVRENIIGITGTRGKTTTTTLIGEILKKAGLPTLLGGNLRGVSTLSLLRQITPEMKVVLELSSWQLQAFAEGKISPHLAVLTNLYEDHLNRYKNIEEYFEDKKNIYRFQNENDYLIINKRIPTLRRDDVIHEAKGKIIWFAAEDVPLTIRKNFCLPGEHNLENLAAAYQAAKILGLDDQRISRGVKGFKGVEFRLQEVGKIGGVTYINDTTSTTPTAGIAAIKTFKGKPIILICGGSSKKCACDLWAKEIVKNVKTVILLEGSGTDDLENNLRILGFQNIKGRFNDFQKAVIAAQKAALPEDVVLFSPGFASFGMFANEYERGEQFNAFLQKIKEKKN